MSKRFLISASLIALLSSQAFATRQTVIDLADRESNQQAIVTKLMSSNDYTFSQADLLILQGFSGQIC